MGDSERIIDTGMTEGDLLDWLDNLTAERIKPIYDPAIHVRAVDYAKRRGGQRGHGAAGAKRAGRTG